MFVTAIDLGTGKTYIGLRIVETLLANCSEWPILIVCYTNHALDQFLEGVQKFCNDRELIRIGGKSQSEAMKELNLANIKSEMRWGREGSTLLQIARDESNDQLEKLTYLQAKTSTTERSIMLVNDRVLGRELADAIKECNEEHYNQLKSFASAQIFEEGVLNWLGYMVNRQSLEYQDNTSKVTGIANNSALPRDAYLKMEAEIDEEEIKEIERERIIDMDLDEEDKRNRYSNKMYHGIREKLLLQNFNVNHPINLDKIVPIDYVDDDGFTAVRNRRSTIKQQFKYEIKKPETMSKEEAGNVADITSLTLKQRWNLYRLWIKMYVKNLEKVVKAHRAEYRNEYLRYNDLRNQEDVEIVKNAKIIGMTTTGAAKYRHIIDGTKPKITSKFMNTID